jgi:hypothetical protein
MIRGLNRFKEHFKSHADSFTLIGGSACFLAMEEAGLNFRATRDLDIVLCIEALNDDFLKAFWLFIKEGGYKQKQKSTNKELFYRFFSPSDDNYPEMLELFSRKPEGLTLKNKSHHLTPIPTSEEISSLSAILLDNDYYNFIKSGIKKIDDLPVITANHLIPLKARAWIDLSNRHNSGTAIDKKNIKKHKNDIIRLYQLLSLETLVVLPESIKNDMRKFLDFLKQDSSLDLKSIGLKNTTLKSLLDNLYQIYDI